MVTSYLNDHYCMKFKMKGQLIKSSGKETRGRIFSHAGYELSPSQARGLWERKQLRTSFLAGNELVPSMTKNTDSRFDFTNMFQAAFTHVDPKRQSNHQWCFALMGYGRIKAAHKTLVTLTPQLQSWVQKYKDNQNSN